MSTNDLYNAEAKQKLKEMVESIDFAMMETNLGSKPSHIIPMSTKKVDDDGFIWFLGNKTSEHNQNILSDSTIQLIYADKSNMEFLTIFGEASVTNDSSKLEELYGTIDDTWFNGANDPNLTAIKVRPAEAHYWDTKHNKLVTLFKMGLGILTGKKQDMGEQGDLNL